jgi:hypothetical protein
MAVPVSALLTPSIEINDPKTPTAVDRTELALSYSVRLPSVDDSLRVEVLVDGVKVAADEARLVDSGGTRAGILHLRIPRRDSTVAAIAYNQNGAGEPAILRVQWRGPGTEPKLNLYVLAIGISDYKDKAFRLRFSAKDAADFVAVAKAQAGGLYEKVDSMELRDSVATRAAILDGLDWINSVVRNTNDVAMIFLSGYGITTPDQRYRFLPYDYDSDRIAGTTISDNELQDSMTRIGGKKVFFLDTSFSGAVLGGRTTSTQPTVDISGVPANGRTPPTRPIVESSGVVQSGRTQIEQADVDRFANELKAAENGIVVFVSSTGKELSRETVANGAFSLAVIEGLRGAAARPQSPVVTVSDLQGYVSRRVRELTDGNQRPMLAMPKTVSDYPISARLR